MCFAAKHATSLLLAYLFVDCLVCNVIDQVEITLSPIASQIDIHYECNEIQKREYLDITLTNPIFPTASLWWLSTWQTKALQRCTAILWIDSSCLAGSRIFSNSWLTRLYWNSSSSGILKLHRVKQQLRWTWGAANKGNKGYLWVQAEIFSATSQTGRITIN